MYPENGIVPMKKKTAIYYKIIFFIKKCSTFIDTAFFNEKKYFLESCTDFTARGCPLHPVYLPCIHIKYN